MNKINCPKCGKMIDSDSKFCTSCGIVLKQFDNVKNIPAQDNTDILKCSPVIAKALKNESEYLYGLAYVAHNDDNKHCIAYILYNTIIEISSDSIEADWAASQIDNIDSMNLLPENIELSEDDGNYLCQQADKAHNDDGNSNVAYYLYDLVTQLIPGSAAAVNAANQMRYIAPDSSLAENIQNQSQQQHYATSAVTGNTDGNRWITGMKIVAYILFAGIIIAGIVIAIQVGQYNGGLGFLLFLASIAVAFLSVAMLMVFLNMAQDISKLTNTVSKLSESIHNMELCNLREKVRK